MRNLKKILALVLALVMSLSLMATASAADFSDVADDNVYKTAIDVLEGLKVFKGYAEDGTFRPEKTITRAEVATIIYRIATGDVDDTQNAIYTTWKKFSDVNDTDWFAGYVNFCANAEYVKGNGNGTFTPQNEVTGYAVLAMILRAMGWDRNHEFEGDDWQIQTAAIARQEGLLDGVTNATEAYLGQSAPRGMVAQILFNALLTETVSYTTLGGYDHTGKTLGGEMFGLESVTGVIMANQWANLNAEDTVGSDEVLPVGETEMKVTKVVTKAAGIDVDDVITLDVETDLDAVGMSWTAYVSGTGTTRTPLTDLVDAGNVVAFNEGKAVGTNYSDEAWASVGKLAADKDLRINNTTTEYFWNYIENWGESATHDILIRYTVETGWVDNDGDYHRVAPEYLIDFLNDCYDDNTATRVGSAAQPVRYTRTISPRDKVEWQDIEIMIQIFYYADRYGENPVNDVWRYVTGEVYVGTSSLEDVSDKMSWKAFCDEYLTLQMDYQYVNAQNGESLRVIDNDGDGVADYVLKITYTMDEVVGTYKDAPLLYSQALSQYDADKNELIAPEDLALGDVVVYSLIDGQLNVRRAESITTKITTNNFKARTVTAEDGTSYGQSGISNETEMAQEIKDMLNQTDYDVYFDLFGFIRAYKLAQESQYALVTEMYGGNSYNSNFYVNTRAIAELVIGDAKVAEYTVADGVNNIFFSKVSTGTTYPWTIGSFLGANSGYNYLQPAVAHLGVGNTYTMGGYTYNAGFATNSPATDATWDRNVNEANGTTTDPASYGVFMYKFANNGDVSDERSYSFTNVAAYTLSDETVTLRTASKLLQDKQGNQLYYNVNALTTADTVNNKAYAAYEKKFSATNWGTDGIVGESLSTALAKGLIAPVYKTDYVQLVPENVSSNKLHYTINGDYTDNYKSIENTYVNATVDTEYYVVTPSEGIFHYTGFATLPEIKADKVRATYAVATNTAEDVADMDYWIADVIVIEVDGLEHSWNSVSLMYYNPYETDGSIRYVDSLNNKWRTYQPDSEDMAMMTVVPSRTGLNTAPVIWGSNPWTDTSNINTTGYGFYALYHSGEPTDGTITARSVTKILAPDKYTDYGIYAGTVTRVAGIWSSGYVDVNVNTTGSGQPGSIWVGIGGTDVPVYRVSTSYENRVTDAVKLDLNRVEDRSGLRTGDQLIWVYEKSNGNLAYIVNVTQSTDSSSRQAYWAPGWLSNSVNGLWKQIYDQMDASSTPYTVNVVIDPAAPLPTGVTAPAGIKSYSAGSAPLTTGSLDIIGYTWSIAAASSTPITSTATATPANSVAVIEDVNEDVTFEVTYTAETVGVTITGNDATTATVTNISVEVNGSTAGVTTGAGGNFTWHYTPGATITVKFDGVAAPATNAKYTYTYAYDSKTNATIAVPTTAGDDGYSFTIAQPTTGTTNALSIDAADLVAVSLDASVPTTTIVKLANGTELSTTPVYVDTSAAVVFTATTSVAQSEIVAASITVGGVAGTAPTYNAANGQFTIPTTSLTGAVVITPTVSSSNRTVNFTAGSTITDWQVTYTDASGVSHDRQTDPASVTVVNNGSVNIYALGQKFTMTISGGTLGTDYELNTTDDGVNWTISNIKADLSITFAP